MVRAPAHRPHALELATLVDDAPDGADWVHEIKFDGYRISARTAGDRITLWSRNGKDWTSALGPVAKALARVEAKSAVLDGEVVVVDPDGRTSFQKLQRALGNPEAPLVYYVFDILEKDGRDLRPLPLIERKKHLQALLRASRVSPRIRFSSHVAGGGPAFFEHACEVGAEGIVSKRAASPYKAGRGRDWLKVKCMQRQEFVIGGFTEPAGTRARFGALLLGVFEGRALRFAGRVGTGFDRRTLDDLFARLAPLERPTAPFVQPPRGADARGVHWVEPKLVAEVSFAEWTNEGIVRHPSFLGLRLDKAPRGITREVPAKKSDSRS